MTNPDTPQPAMQTEDAGDSPKDICERLRAVFVVGNEDRFSAYDEYGGREKHVHRLAYSPTPVMLEAAAEIERLRAELKKVKSFEYFQVCAAHWRGIDDRDCCEECQGSGRKGYANTATWRGGIGGQVTTNSVCDKCWGSGEKHRPWTSWRKKEGLERKANQARQDALEEAAAAAEKYAEEANKAAEEAEDIEEGWQASCESSAASTLAERIRALKEAPND